MEQLKLANGKIYNLAINGVIESEDSLTLTVLRDGLTFEQVEQDFSVESNIEKIHVLDSLGETMSVIVGFGQLKSMEAILDYEISRETINVGTEEIPEYETSSVTGAVFVVRLSKPDLQKKIKDLQETVEFLVIEQLKGV